ncbi:Arachidonate 5-lipoxygenase-activating protein [Varanus komodoensis]|nr:Arachidonate 5-lipoxygenase-activating protein [Varanus komodoensis]
MDQEVVGYIVLLVIVTLLSVVQNAFFASKVEQESKNSTGKIVQRGGSSAFERVFTARAVVAVVIRSILLRFGLVHTLGLPFPKSAKTAETPIQHFLPYFGVLACCVAKRHRWPTASIANFSWCANYNCYWTGIALGDPWITPAAFAGLMYLFVRQKYFIGYMGERTQSTPGYIFGKRIILFLFLMSVAGVLNYYLGVLFGSDFQIYIKTVTGTISPLLLIP